MIDRNWVLSLPAVSLVATLYLHHPTGQAGAGFWAITIQFQLPLLFMPPRFRSCGFHAIRSRTKPITTRTRYRRAGSAGGEDRADILFWRHRIEMHAMPNACLPVSGESRCRRTSAGHRQRDGVTRYRTHPVSTRRPPIERSISFHPAACCSGVASGFPVGTPAGYSSQLLREALR